MRTNSILSYKCFVLKLPQTVLSGLLKHLGINLKFTKLKINQNQIEMFQTNQRTNIKSENRKKKRNRKKRNPAQLGRTRGPNQAAT
jgi:hypothetical protein